MATHYSNGKLLMTGEYLVLDGAKALALPTKFGQNLTIHSTEEPTLIWESYSHQNDKWLQVEFDLPRLRIVSETFNATVDGGNDSIALTLQNILLVAKKLNPNFISDNKGFHVKTTLTFPRNWGLGSSSTLINNIARWAKVNAFKLQFETFGGSAYDIACAQNDYPIRYQLLDRKPEVKRVDFDPKFKEQLYFVHLNKKQDSRKGIAEYKRFNERIHPLIDEVSQLTNALISCTQLDVFDKLLADHEQLIASIIKQKPIQSLLFHDYFGQIKSLGAWGGDFILATGNNDTPTYFKQKGFSTILPYQDMIL